MKSQFCFQTRPQRRLLGALLHDVGKPPTLRVADRIRFDDAQLEGRIHTAGEAMALVRELFPN